MPVFDPSKKNQVMRNPTRGSYDSATIFPIVDEAPICHVGFFFDNRPVVIPTIHVRDGNRIIFHGSTKSRMLLHMASGAPLCVTVSIVDALVMARSVFHHSMNYRSAVLFGAGEVIRDDRDVSEGFRLLTEKIMPGRWNDARQPSAKEKKATLLVSMEIDSASAKVRSGPPVDDEEDYDADVWAGLISFDHRPSGAESDPRLKVGVPVPEYMQRYLNEAG